MSQNKFNECLVEVPIPIDYTDLADLDIHKLCRICLTMKDTDADMVSLISTKESKIGDMFSTITSIQIYSYDGFPNQICTECKRHVEGYYDFRMKCQKSHSILKSILNGEVKEEVHDIKKFYIQEVDKQDASTEEIKTEDATFKDEEDLHENVEYLDEFVENDAENKQFLIERIPEVKRSQRNKLHIHITDSQTLLEEVVSDRSKTNKRKNLTCDVCFKTFHKMKTYRGHMRLHRGPASQPHSCTKCKASFATEHDLKLHTAVHNRGPLWKCNECCKEFTGRAALARHVKRHMQVKGFACERCGKTFTELYALRRHARVHTGEAQDKRHCCHLCDKRYVSRNKLAEHVARHGGTRPCVCACGKAFADARLLASHRRVHTDRKPHKCKYCDQRFRHESTRNTHHRTHTGEKPYVCATCGKTFIQNSNLRLHMRTHTGEKPYSCDICKRRFASGSTLKNHQIVHSGDKPYNCEICGKRFARRDTLTSHARTHSAPRPFACGSCPRAFTAAARLREHSRVHTGEKPYECVMCPQRFASKSHLVKHSKKHFKHVVKKDTSAAKEVEDNVATQEKSESFIEIETVDLNKDIHLDIEEMPLEVSQELILEDSDMKAEIMVINESGGYANGLSLNAVNVVNCDVNLITVKEDELGC